jgi:hypothetical protein
VEDLRLRNTRWGASSRQWFANHCKATLFCVKLQSRERGSAVFGGKGVEAYQIMEDSTRILA